MIDEKMVKITCSLKIYAPRKKKKRMQPLITMLQGINDFMLKALELGLALLQRLINPEPCLFLVSPGSGGPLRVFSLMS